ncbi:MAG: hypothetical protein AB8H80_05990 [Planctomycetota bacterium]
MTRLFRLSAILSVLALCATLVPAQSRNQNPGQESSRKQRQKDLQRAAGGDGRALEEQDKYANMTPEERLEHGARRGGARGHVTFVATCRPPKLLPGQTGTMLISAILQKRAVIPAPAQITVMPTNQPGSASVGSLTVRPAAVGRLASAYIGRPVYENTAVFEAPVTMGAQAKMGSSETISIDLKFDIYDGETGQAICRAIERVSTTVKVAPHADPAVAGRTAPPRSAEPTEPVATIAPAGVAPAGSPEDASPAVSGGTPGVVMSVPEPDVADPVSPTDTGSVPVAGEGGIPPLMLAVGGAVLLLLVLLLMRRK